MIDLHTHSTASDGQYAPSELMSLAAEKGLSAIALTDHDTTDGISEAYAAAQRYGITFVPGIEISVDGVPSIKELHILGYYIDENSPIMRHMCEMLKVLRHEREERIFEYLEDAGVKLDKKAVERYAKKGIVARPHFARAMVDAGIVATVREAFDRYLAVPAFDRIERPKPTPEAGIRCILEAGGIPVLAHPAKTGLALSELHTLAHTLKETGLQGIECYYSTHTPQQTRDYLELADSLGLTVTGGSDFHGEKIKPDIVLGRGIHGSLCIKDAEILHKQGGKLR